MIEINFDIEPVGQLRPRAVRVGKSIRMYDPKKVADFKDLLKRTAKEKMKSNNYGCVPDGIPLEVSIITYHKVPKSWSKEKRRKSFNNYKITKYDLDNEIKSILDSLNGIVWADDNQIAKIVAEKRYVKSDNDEPHFYIKIKSLN